MITARVKSASLFEQSLVYCGCHSCNLRSLKTHLGMTPCRWTDTGNTLPDVRECECTSGDEHESTWKRAPRNTSGTTALGKRGLAGSTTRTLPQAASGPHSWGPHGAAGPSQGRRTLPVPQAGRDVLLQERSWAGPSWTRTAAPAYFALSSIITSGRGSDPTLCTWGCLASSKSLEDAENRHCSYCYRLENNKQIWIMSSG